MKYKVGDVVFYNNKECVVDRIEETTTIIAACGCNTSARISIMYDLYDLGKDEYIYSVPEIEISEKLQKKEFEWDESAVYKLVNGSVAWADLEEQCLILDNDITIPFDLYDENGNCEYWDFTIKDKKWED